MLIIRVHILLLKLQCILSINEGKGQGNFSPVCNAVLSFVAIRKSRTSNLELETSDGPMDLIRRSILKELITPNGDLKVGHDIAEWDAAPSPLEVKEKTNGNSYEERSGTLLTDDLKAAR